MPCSVCKNNFIRSADLTEYYQTKKKFDDRIIKIIDTLTDDELSKMNDDIWNVLLNYESLILLPNEEAKKCSTETCDSAICNFCYTLKKEIMCLECKKTPIPPPSSFSYEFLIRNK